MIESLSQLQDVLNNSRGSWAWVGQRGIDAFTVLEMIPVKAVFCCDYGEDYADLWQSETLFSVERDTGRRESWGNKDLERLWEGETGKRIERFIENAQTPINTVCYRSLSELEKDRRFRVLAPSKALKDKFDDKLHQLDLFARLNIKTPKTLACRLSDTTFANTSAMLNGAFVVQPPVGSSGENTYIIDNQAEFDRVRGILHPTQWVKISKYLPVPSLNGHCIVLRTSTGLLAIAVCPSVQIVGAKGCTNRAEIYCGNDFSAAGDIPEAVREEACTMMEKVGLDMGQKGFLGIFGMDFLLHDDEVMALEINPRFQGSTMLLSLLQLARGEVPLAALHVLQFADQIEALSATFLRDLGRRYRTPYSGAHLIVHNLGSETRLLEHTLTSGIHTLKNDAVEKVRSGTTWRDVKGFREWCILGNLPIPGTKIHREARLVMAHTGERVLDGGLRQLKPSAVSFVDGLQRQFRTISFEGGKE